MVVFIVFYRTWFFIAFVGYDKARALSNFVSLIRIDLERKGHHGLAAVEFFNELPRRLRVSEEVAEVASFINGEVLSAGPR